MPLRGEGEHHQGGACCTPAAGDGLAAGVASAFGASPCAVVLTEPSGTIEYVNDSFCALTGYEPDEVLGTPVWLLRANPDEARGLLPLFLARGRPARVEFQARRKDGSLLWVASSVSPLGDTRGAITHVLSILEDITPYRQALEEMATGGQRPDSVLVAELDGRIRFINRTVPGITPAEVIGGTVFDFVPEEHHDSLRARIAEVVDGKQSVTYEIPAIGPHGSVARYVTRLGPIERDGRVVALSFVSSALDDAVAATMSGGDCEQAAHVPALSTRELEVLELLARGLTNREAADALDVSRRTVDHHVSHILTKLEVSNRTAAVVAAERAGLLPTLAADA